jgi:hypothetical protein
LLSDAQANHASNKHAQTHPKTRAPNLEIQHPAKRELIVESASISIVDLRNPT